ncbi:hypothetical protein DPEC_G00085290 [Dallia pectoralis]|uniref:Uncharacterized protein n=1 Tax=Dallia pectoralis TaxID=75939 RepID=A0ACC2GZG6_DALPE|nr:hypothetical protein DPEC_G00085290 [Dallia pectoralis]
MWNQVFPPLASQSQSVFTRDWAPGPWGACLTAFSLPGNLGWALKSGWHSCHSSPFIPPLPPGYLIQTLKDPPGPRSHSSS